MKVAVTRGFLSGRDKRGTRKLLEGITGLAEKTYHGDEQNTEAMDPSPKTIERVTYRSKEIRGFKERRAICYKRFRSV